MVRTVHSFVDLAAQYGPYALLALAALLYILEGLGLPLPVEIPLVIVARLVVEHTIQLRTAIVLAWITTVAGNTAGYFLGRVGGRPLLYQLAVRFHIPESSVEKAEGWFKRHGLKLVIGTRWINWGFAQNIWLTGISRVPFVRFLTLMAINDLLWAVAYNWVFVNFFELIRFTFHRYEREALLILLAVGLIGVGIWVVRRKRRLPVAPADSDPGNTTGDHDYTDLV